MTLITNSRFEILKLVDAAQHYQTKIKAGLFSAIFYSSFN